MGHKGPKANEINVESNIFEGMHFGKHISSNIKSYKMNKFWFLVVLVDPKSRTGQDDRKQLIISWALFVS